MINGFMEDVDVYDLWRLWFAFRLIKGEDSKNYSGG
jgi:hypothetical protein